jgi:hypothetical protein
VPVQHAETNVEFFWEFHIGFQLDSPLEHDDLFYEPTRAKSAFYPNQFARCKKG